MDQAVTHHQPIGFSGNTQKASHDDQHSLSLVSAFFCLILSISIDLHTNVPQMQTVVFQSPAPKLWGMLQNSQHEQIWQLNCGVWWCWGNACPPWHYCPGHNTNQSQHTGPKLWNICQVQWGHESSKGSGAVAGTFLATSGKTPSTRTYHQLAVTLHPYSPCRHADEPIHAAMQQYTDTLCTIQQQMNLGTSLLKDIPIFDGWDTMKLEDWYSNACLAVAKSCDLTHTSIHEALQAGKCWDDIRDILCLKLCNVSIHTYTLHFMEIQQRDNETLAAYVVHFKMKAKWCDFSSDTTTISIFVRVSGVHTTLQQRYMKRTSDLSKGHQTSVEAEHSTKGYSYLVTPYGEHDVEWW